MTQDRYMSRGRVHSQVADLVDRTVTDVNHEQVMTGIFCGTENTL